MKQSNLITYINRIKMQQKYIVSKHAVNIETRTAILQLAYLHIPHECSNVCY